MKLLRRILWGMTITCWIIMFILTHVPGRDLPKVHLNDKIEHFIAYGTLAGLLYVSLWLPRPRLWGLPGIVLGIAAIYGALDEFLQKFVPSRSCDIRDWIADVIGALLAIGVMFCVRYLATRGTEEPPPAAGEAG